ncbi:MAG: hypothetical protein P4M12_06745 [Gammaproteobacteria bacterium]|nr:hypothetical protein [Gammaproteobacteria bacterium]
MDNTTLQEKLIRSLEVLAPESKEIKRINAVLKDRYIPNDDYRNVLNFILLLLKVRPDIIDNPNDNALALKELCNECIDHCTPSEHKPKAHPHRSKH